ncbi:MAG: dihydrofolate reductase [Pseudomonadota bacterium]
MDEQTINLVLIAAIGDNDVIGVEGGLPWRLSSDLKRFKQITMGKPIIMGRKTYESIGKPLPGRLNIVVTRNSDFSADGIEIVSGIEAGIARARQHAELNDVDEICVIGGGEIYSKTIGSADRLYITHVLASPEGDTKFPEIDQDYWQIAHEEDFPAGEKDIAATRFAVYDRL